MQIEKRETPNYVPDRRGHFPLGVVIHTTEGSFESVVSWFGDPASEVSSHYLVGLDGRVAQFVDETHTARHAGRVLRPTTALVRHGNPNLFTIGIEFEDGGDPSSVERPAAQYRVGAELLLAVALRWDFPLDSEHVVRHSQIFAGKTCPGNFDVERLLREAWALI